MLSVLLWNDDGVTVGRKPTVKRFVKGVFKCRLSLPKYLVIWDVNIVFEHLKPFFLLSDFFVDGDNT